MKHLSYCLALVGLLAGCAKKEDAKPASDPFLGHWVASEAHVVTYASTGQVSHDNVDVNTYTADVTATAFTATKTATGGASDTRTYTYTRSGETLTLTPTTGQIVYTARNLTADGWTYESLGTYATGSTRTTIVYHR